MIWGTAELDYEGLSSDITRLAKVRFSDINIDAEFRIAIGFRIAGHCASCKKEKTEL